MRRRTRPLRTLAVSLVPAAVVAALWSRFEVGGPAPWRVAAVVALGLAVALVRPLALRLPALLVAAVLVVWTAFGLSPLHPHGSLDALGSRGWSGFLDFYDVRLPFDPALHADMASLVLVAIAVFVAAAALAVDARRPLLATLLVLAGAGWPATLAGPGGAVAAGTAVLLACLVVLAGLTDRRVPHTAVAACALVAAAAAGVAGAPAVAKPGVVHWQSWNPTGSDRSAVGVSFVWNSQYTGLHWPKKRTTVLEVEAPPEPALYWRAAVLDDFLSSGWEQGAPRPADVLEPARASLPADQTKQTVTVKALADTRLVGGGVPMRFDTGEVTPDVVETGFAQILSGLPRGFRYDVWSYAPQPTARQLRASPPRYPPVLSEDGLLDVWPGVAMPAFGVRSRATRVAEVRIAHPELAPDAPLARLARQVAGGATTPYGAALSLERWFRVSGGFRYSNRGTLAPHPLVDFVTRTRRGYCQYFAGAMALMLRYLGVPARVAVGFSSGRYDDARGVWVVTDHDAHAWVEAWFAGYGWLPFDPTPAANRPEQGVLSAAYSSASPDFSSPSGAGGVYAAPSPAPSSRHRSSASGTGVGAPGPVQAPASHTARNVVLVLLALGLGLLAVLGGTKLALRARRLHGRDPRRVAAGCRRELAAFLLDQRVAAARSATLHELGALLRRELEVDAGPFVAAASAARFGRPEEAEGAARAARRELRRLLRLARAKLSGRERARGLLSLRSLRA